VTSQATSSQLPPRIGVPPDAHFLDKWPVTADLVSGTQSFIYPEGSFRIPEAEVFPVLPALVLSVFGMGARCMTEPTTKLLREITIVIKTAGKSDLADGLVGVRQRTALKEVRCAI
jgi:hypothetical protein